MTDLVTTKTLSRSDEILTQHLTNASDGTGESAVVKLDISSLLLNGQAVTALTVVTIEFIVSGMNYVTLAWDATTDDTIALLANSGIIDFQPHSGNSDPQSTGSTGDVVLTTDGAVDGGMYDIIIQYVLEV